MGEIASSELTREIRLEDTGTPEYLWHTHAIEEVYMSKFVSRIEAAGSNVDRIHNMRGDLKINGYLCELKQIQVAKYGKSASVEIRQIGKQVANVNLGTLFHHTSRMTRIRIH